MSMILVNYLILLIPIIFLTFNGIVLPLSCKLFLSKRRTSIFNSHYAKFSSSDKGNIPILVNLVIPILCEHLTVAKLLQKISEIPIPDSIKLKVWLVGTLKEEKVQKRCWRNNVDALVHNIDKLLPLREINAKFSFLLKHQITQDDIKNFAILPSRQKYRIIYKLVRKPIHTREVIAQILSRFSHKRIMCQYIECPLTEGSKASHLNFFLSYIKSEGKDVPLNCSWIYIVDADTIPEQNIFRLFIENSKKNENLRVFQQITLPFRELNKASTTTQIIEASQQAKWQCGFESLRLKLARLCTCHKFLDFLKPPIYLVGTGLWVREDLLVETNGFPEPVEDTVLGYRLSFRNEPIGYLPSIMLGQTPKSIKNIIVQQSFWFYGVLHIFQEFKIWMTKPYKTPYEIIRNCSLLLRELIIDIEWMLGPIFVIACIIYGEFVFNHTMWLYYVMIIGILLIINYPLDSLYLIKIGINYSVSRFEKEEISLNAIQILKAILFSPFRAFWRSSAPWVAVFKLITQKFFPTRIKFNSTPKY